MPSLDAKPPSIFDFDSVSLRQLMTQLHNPVEPFGEVNVYRQQNGTLDVVATVLMVPDVEGASAGLALDASASMKKSYGVSGVLGGLFAKEAAIPNLVEPVARVMANYLAGFASDGKVHLIYWACNPDGSAVEEIGKLNSAETQSVAIKGPTRFPWGRGTKLLPALKHFVECAFEKSPWSICVFVTDGVIEDLAEVKSYCLELGKQIAAGQRHFCKLVLIGVGEEVDEGQMEELDDMFAGSGLKDQSGREVDLWDHKLAGQMQKVEEIFAEVVSEDTVVVSSGRVVDSAGKSVKEYPDGVPALLRFSLPAGAKAFTLEFPGGSVTQDLTEVLARI
jgi:hypothetical protein